MNRASLTVGLVLMLATGMGFAAEVTDRVAREAANVDWRASIVAEMQGLAMWAPVDRCPTIDRAARGLIERMLEMDVSRQGDIADLLASDLSEGCVNLHRLPGR